MKPENAIEVTNITKSFKVYPDRSNNIKDYVIHGRRRKYEVRDVIKGLSFEVRKGEAVGLIGHNGCGKSTTLKLLSRIMYPDSGKIEMRGRVSSMIELGAGFHPDMSGRENIYINATIFGLKRSEVDKRIDDIIAFSELEPFIDNPVRTYSSGMYMRLAFAVAINVNADILLIDEILAVGDAAFQLKCFKRLKQIKAEGTTIIIVSHSMPQIEQICDRCIWLHEGVVHAEGNPKTVDGMYTEYMMSREISTVTTGAENEEAMECAAILKGLFYETLKENGAETSSDDSGENISSDMTSGIKMNEINTTVSRKELGLSAGNALFERIQDRLITYFDTPRSDNCEVRISTDREEYSAEALKSGTERITVHIRNTGDEVITSHRRSPIYLSYHILGSDGKLIENDGRRTVIDEYLSKDDECEITLLFDNKDMEHLVSGNKLVITLVAEYLFWLDANGGNHKTVELK